MRPYKKSTKVMRKLLSSLRKDLLHIKILLLMNISYARVTWIMLLITLAIIPVGVAHLLYQLTNSTSLPKVYIITSQITLTALSVSITVISGTVAAIRQEQLYEQLLLTPVRTYVYTTTILILAILSSVCGFLFSLATSYIFFKASYIQLIAISIIQLFLTVGLVPIGILAGTTKRQITSDTISSGIYFFFLFLTDAISPMDPQKYPYILLLPTHNAIEAIKSVLINKHIFTYNFLFITIFAVIGFILANSLRAWKIRD